MMVFIKKADFKRALGIWDQSILPRQFMLDMLDEYGYAYWISGVLNWCCRCAAEPIPVSRYLGVQRKIRSVGFAIHEDIPLNWNMVTKQEGLWNRDCAAVIDFRHARFLDKRLSDWSAREKKKAKRAAAVFPGGDLMDFCRLPGSKREGYRDIQLLIEHYLGYHKHHFIGG